MSNDRSQAKPIVTDTEETDKMIHIQNLEFHYNAGDFRLNVPVKRRS